MSSAARWRWWWWCCADLFELESGGECDDAHQRGKRRRKPARVRRRRPQLQRDDDEKVKVGDLRKLLDHHSLQEEDDGREPAANVEGGGDPIIAKPLVLRHLFRAKVDVPIGHSSRGLRRRRLFLCRGACCLREGTTTVRRGIQIKNRAEHAHRDDGPGRTCFTTRERSAPNWLQ